MAYAAPGPRVGRSRKGDPWEMAAVRQLPRGAAVWVAFDGGWEPARLLGVVPRPGGRDLAALQLTSATFASDDPGNVPGGGGGGTLGSPVHAPLAEVFAANPPLLDGEADLVRLSHLSEPALLHNLAARYAAGGGSNGGSCVDGSGGSGTGVGCVASGGVRAEGVYTSAGPVLLALNPFTPLPALYGHEVRSQFRARLEAALSGSSTSGSSGAGGSAAVPPPPPHVFSVANDAFAALVREGRPQSLLISGESGAGKTETTKYALQYVAELAAGGGADAAAAGGAGRGVEQRVLDTNPLLEAFGNAKTLRNSNSSRFGKLLRLRLLGPSGGASGGGALGPPPGYGSAARHRVEGAAIETYLLEKSRVSHPPQGERNFHVFYQLVAGASADERSAYHLLPDTEGYAYLSRGGCTAIAGVDDASDFVEVKKAMSSMGIDEQQQSHVFRLLAGVLWLGNVSFRDTEHDGAEVAPCREQGTCGGQGWEGQVDQPQHDGAEGAPCGGQVRDALREAAALLGVCPEALQLALLKKRMQAGGGDVIYRNLTAEAAADSRDVLSRSLYSALFDWLTARLNEALGGGSAGGGGQKSSSTCHGNGASFTQGTATAAAVAAAAAPGRQGGGSRSSGSSGDGGGGDGGQDGGGHWLNILDIFGFECFRSNGFEQLCINYANERLQGQFNRHLLGQEQEVYESEGVDWSEVEFTDNSACVQLLELRQATPTNGLGVLAVLDEQCRMPQGSDAAYAAALRSVHSGHPHFHAKLGNHQFGIHHYAGTVVYDTGGFVDKNKDLLSAELLSVVQGSSHPLVQQLYERHLGQRGGGPSHQTVGGRFRQQLQQLVSHLDSTGLHFIRCIKPNAAMTPGEFDGSLVASQLRCAGVMEVTRIAKAGFPTRYTYERFAGRYGVLLSSGMAGGGARAMTQQLLAEWRIPDDTYRLGHTRVFFKAGVLARLEARFEQLQRAAVVVQSYARMWRCMAQLRRMVQAATEIQAGYRGMLARRHVAALPAILNGAAATIQAHWRGRRTRHALHTQNKAAIAVQMAFRRWQFRQHVAARRDVMLRQREEEEEQRLRQQQEQEEEAEERRRQQQQEEEKRRRKEEKEEMQRQKAEEERMQHQLHAQQQQQQEEDRREQLWIEAERLELARVEQRLLQEEEEERQLLADLAARQEDRDSFAGAAAVVSARSAQAAAAEGRGDGRQWPQLDVDMDEEEEEEEGEEEEEEEESVLWQQRQQGSEWAQEGEAVAMQAEAGGDDGGDNVSGLGAPGVSSHATPLTRPPSLHLLTDEDERELLELESRMPLDREQHALREEVARGHALRSDALAQQQWQQRQRALAAQAAPPGGGSRFSPGASVNASAASSGNGCVGGGSRAAAASSNASLRWSVQSGSDGDEAANCWLTSPLPAPFQTPRGPSAATAAHGVSSSATTSYDCLGPHHSRRVSSSGTGATPGWAAALGSGRLASVASLGSQAGERAARAAELFTPVILPSSPAASATASRSTTSAAEDDGAGAGGGGGDHVSRSTQRRYTRLVEQFRRASAAATSASTAVAAAASGGPSARGDNYPGGVAAGPSRIAAAAAAAADPHQALRVSLSEALMSSWQPECEQHGEWLTPLPTQRGEGRLRRSFGARSPADAAAAAAATEMEAGQQQLPHCHQEAGGSSSPASWGHLLGSDSGNDALSPGSVGGSGSAVRSLRGAASSSRASAGSCGRALRVLFEHAVEEGGSVERSAGSARHDDGAAACVEDGPNGAAPPVCCSSPGAGSCYSQEENAPPLQQQHQKGVAAASSSKQRSSSFSASEAMRRPLADASNASGGVPRASGHDSLQPVGMEGGREASAAHHQLPLSPEHMPCPGAASPQLAAHHQHHQQQEHQTSPSLWRHSGGEAPTEASARATRRSLWGNGQSSVGSSGASTGGQGSLSLTASSGPVAAAPAVGSDASNSSNQGDPMTTPAARSSGGSSRAAGSSAGCAGPALLPPIADGGSSPVTVSASSSRHYSRASCARGGANARSSSTACARDAGPADAAMLQAQADEAARLHHHQRLDGREQPSFDMSAAAPAAASDNGSGTWRNTDDAQEAAVPATSSPATKRQPAAAHPEGNHELIDRSDSSGIPAYWPEHEQQQGAAGPGTGQGGNSQAAAAAGAGADTLRIGSSSCMENRHPGQLHAGTPDLATPPAASLAAQVAELQQLVAGLRFQNKALAEELAATGAAATPSTLQCTPNSIHTNRLFIPNLDAPSPFLDTPREGVAASPATGQAGGYATPTLQQLQRLRQLPPGGSGGASTPGGAAARAAPGTGLTTTTMASTVTSLSSVKTNGAAAAPGAADGVSCTAKIKALRHDFTAKADRLDRRLSRAAGAFAPGNNAVGGGQACGGGRGGADTGGTAGAMTGEDPERELDEMAREFKEFKSAFKARLKQAKALAQRSAQRAAPPGNRLSQQQQQGMVLLESDDEEQEGSQLRHAMGCMPRAALSTGSKGKRRSLQAGDCGSPGDSVASVQQQQQPSGPPAKRSFLSRLLRGNRA